MFGWKSATRQKTNRMMESTGACDGGATGVMSGIVAGTRVATTMGWRDVTALAKGDLVMTFDGGLQEVTAIDRRPMWSGSGACPRAFWPLLVPVGALENTKPMMVLPRQGVMLESDVAEAVMGDPFALIPAVALEGVGGIERAYPNDPIEVVTVQFATDQVIFAEQGALLFCPAAADLIAVAAAAQAGLNRPYEMLSRASAMDLLHGATGREFARGFAGAQQGAGYETVFVQMAAA